MKDGALIAPCSREVSCCYIWNGTPIFYNPHEREAYVNGRVFRSAYVSPHYFFLLHRIFYLDERRSELEVLSVQSINPLKYRCVLHLPVNVEDIHVRFGIDGIYIPASIREKAGAIEIPRDVVYHVTPRKAVLCKALTGMDNPDYVGYNHAFSFTAIYRNNTLTEDMINTVFYVKGKRYIVRRTNKLIIKEYSGRLLFVEDSYSYITSIFNIDDKLIGVAYGVEKYKEKEEHVGVIFDGDQVRVFFLSPEEVMIPCFKYLGERG